jgi:hypothetical protein
VLTDPALHKKLSECALAASRHFDAEAMITAYSAIFDRAIAGLTVHDGTES